MKMALQIRSKIVLLLGDVTLLILSLALATNIRLGSAWFIPEEYGAATILCALLFPFALFLARAYEVHPQASLAENLRRPFFGVALAGFATSFFFYFAPDYRFGRGIYVLMILIYVLLLGIWRTVFFLQVRQQKLSVLVMGEPAHVKTACKVLKEYSPATDVRIWPQGAPGNGDEAAPEPDGGGPRNGAYDLVVLAGETLEAPVIRRAAEFRLQGLLVWDLPRLYAELAERLPAEHIGERWLATADGFHFLNKQTLQIVKRLGDVTLALAALLASLPVLLLSILAIKLDDGGEVFYSQERIGFRGRTFRVYKLRTMIADAEEETGPVWASRRDPRATRVGRWLRRLRIDEIPQMWNVLKGDMSLVGPRPERPVFVEAIQRKYPTYTLRHMLRPGITGWAQIRYPYTASQEDALQKLEYDLYYVQNASFLFDLRIILKTISIVFTGWGSR